MFIESQSRPSYKPSPLVAHVLWMYLQSSTCVSAAESPLWMCLLLRRHRCCLAATSAKTRLASQCALPGVCLQQSCRGKSAGGRLRPVHHSTLVQCRFQQQLCLCKSQASAAERPGHGDVGASIRYNWRSRHSHHLRCRIECRPSLSVTSATVIAFGRSCLLANTNRTASLSSSCTSLSDQHGR
jgi:hypothetical protein